MADDALDAILRDPSVEVHVLRSMAKAIGLLELDFREEGACELAFFGLVADAIGTGAGRALMDEAIDRAWARPIERFWVAYLHASTMPAPSTSTRGPAFAPLP